MVESAIMKVEYIQIGPNDEGQRIDNYLIKRLKGVPKSYIYRIVRSGQVRVNKKRVKVNTKLVKGDEIRIPPIRVTQARDVTISENLKELIASRICYVDDKLLVFNKPAGMAVHGGSGLSFGVIEALRKCYPEQDYLELVHRLDRETSGCLLIAKKRSVLRELHEQLQLHQMNKIYWALLNGQWKGTKRQIVEKPLLKNTLKSGERIVRVDDNGKSAKTYFKLLNNYQQACLVEAKPVTGRTHQIRVHSLDLGLPILGDDKYGDKLENRRFKKVGLQRMFLHAYQIEFTLNGKPLMFRAPLDESLQYVLDELEKS